MVFSKNVMSFFLVVCLVPFYAQAADRSFSIQVDAIFEPTSAVAIILGKNGVSEHPAASFKRNKNGVLVELTVPESEITDETTVTAMVSGANGERAYGEMRPLLTYSPPEALPTCPDKAAKESLDAGSLEQLIDLRTRRRDIAKKQISEVLSSDGLADKLANVEQLFGLNLSGQPFSADLEPLQLLERLTRINAAVESYRLGRQKTAATQSSPTAVESVAANEAQ